MVPPLRRGDSAFPTSMVSYRGRGRHLLSPVRQHGDGEGGVQNTTQLRVYDRAAGSVNRRPRRCAGRACYNRRQVTC